MKAVFGLITALLLTGCCGPPVYTVLNDTQEAIQVTLRCPALSGENEFTSSISVDPQGAGDLVDRFGGCSGRPLVDVSEGVETKHYVLGGPESLPKALKGVTPVDASNLQYRCRFLVKEEGLTVLPQTAWDNLSFNLPVLILVGLAFGVPVWLLVNWLKKGPIIQ